MKKNTNWKGGGGAQRHKYLLLPDHGCRNRENAQKGKLAFSGAFAHTLDNETKYNESYTNTFYKTPNRSIKYFRILRLLQQLLQLNPYIDKRLTIECILQVYVGVTINVSSSISSSDSRQTLIYKKSVL